MILTEVRRILQANGPTSLGELARELHSEPDAVRAMLAVWVDKGRVARLSVAERCGSRCQRCDPEQTEVFVWTGGGDRGSASETECPGVGSRR